MSTFIKLRERVDEMEENAKSQDGRDKPPLIFKWNKQHVLLHFLTYKLQVNIFLVCKEYILHFILIIYVLYSFTGSFSTFIIGLLFTHTMAFIFSSYSAVRTVDYSTMSFTES